MGQFSPSLSFLSFVFSFIPFSILSNFDLPWASGGGGPYTFLTKIYSSDLIFCLLLDWAAWSFCSLVLFISFLNYLTILSYISSFSFSFLSSVSICQISCSPVEVVILGSMLWPHSDFKRFLYLFLAVKLTNYRHPIYEASEL